MGLFCFWLCENELHVVEEYLSIINAFDEFTLTFNWHLIKKLSKVRGGSHVNAWHSCTMSLFQNSKSMDCMGLHVESFDKKELQFGWEMEISHLGMCNRCSYKQPWYFHFFWKFVPLIILHWQTLNTNNKLNMALGSTLELN